MDDSPKKNSKLSIRPQTHDISRIEYHIEELKTFGDVLTEAAVAAFPNKGKTRYAAVHVLLLSWENDTLGVITELLELQEVLQTNYSFHTEEWKIPSNRSHNSLAHRIMQFLAEFESQENLLIIYYGGHGNMNDDRQCVWSCSSELDSSEVQWYGLQTMLEQARSDVLILLDCCAAASSAAGSGTGVTEVIAACGFESTAPGVGEHSFTRSLIEELKHLSYGPSFSAALLHNKVLSRMKYFKPRFATGGNREQRRTPVYILLANERKRRSIELTPMVSQNPLTINKGLQFGSSTQVSTPSSGPSNDVDMQSSESSKSSVDEIWHDVDPDCPKVLISIALEKDQLLGQDEWTEWLKSVPALVNNVTVEGVFKSDSTLYLLSLPVAVWDMLPENRAISFIGFVRSTNMVPTLKKPTRARNLAQANSTFMPMTGLAISHSDLERRKEGMELEEKVLKARQSTLGSETPDGPLAMEMREKVLKASQRTLADEHPDILLAFHNLAINYSNLGRPQEAIELGEKVLEASQRMLGSEHPNTLRAMAGLANSYSNLGRRQEAMEMREKVLEASRRTLGDKHPNTLLAMSGLANSYSDLGHRQEAMEMREKVLEASQRTLGNEHPDSLLAMTGLANSYSDLGHRQEAMEMREKVLEASQRTLGNEHPDSLLAMTGPRQLTIARRLK